jgi:DNA-binding MarR family transcriptional regulator
MMIERPAIPRERCDLRIVRALRRISRNIDVQGRALSASHQVTGPQLACLLELAAVPEPLTTSGIAHRVDLSTSTVIGILDRLAARALITRERSHEDRRVVLVKLTERGRAVAQTTALPWQAKLARELDRLNARQQNDLARCAERIADLLE